MQLDVSSLDNAKGLLKFGDILAAHSLRHGVDEHLWAVSEALKSTVRLPDWRNEGKNKYPLLYAIHTGNEDKSLFVHKKSQ